MVNGSFTSEAIGEFARDWYKKLDVHAPMVELLPMLVAKDLFMIFPEATLTGLAAFESWYQGVIRIFFDEVHNVQSVQSTIHGDEAEVKIVVRWEASRWNPPARNSDRIITHAYQTWNVKKSSGSSKMVVTKYIVDKIEYLEGSAKL